MIRTKNIAKKMQKSVEIPVAQKRIALTNKIGHYIIPM